MLCMLSQAYSVKLGHFNMVKYYSATASHRSSSTLCAPPSIAHPSKGMPRHTLYMLLSPCLL